MASKIRRIYTYTDQQGKEQTVLINGNTAKDTDKKFQVFLSGVAAVLQEKETPTLKQFIDEVYRSGFMEAYIHREHAKKPKILYSRFVFCTFFSSVIHRSYVHLVKKTP